MRLWDDVHNLDLNADLVTLSACETGLGEIQKGEGIMSIGRAFTSAGSKRNIISLWQVNDRSTMEIMKSFYQNIHRGSSVSTSLRDAKLQFLERASITESHPYFWSGLQLMGDTQPILKRSFSIQAWIGIGLGIVLLLLVGRNIMNQRFPKAA